MIAIVICIVAFVAFLLVSLPVWAKAVDSDHPLALLGVLGFHLAGSFAVVVVGAVAVTIFPAT